MTTKKKNIDGWSNVLTNLGNQKDTIEQTKLKPFGRLSDSALENVYRSDGIARKIIDMPIDDALRPWIKADDHLLDDLKKCKFKNHLSDAAKWSRLYGGCLLVVFLDDGKDFDEPVDRQQQNEVLQIQAFEKPLLSWTSKDIETDPREPMFGLPKFYTIRKTNGISFKVHHSRFFRFDGLNLPSREKERNDGWGDSILAPILDSLKYYNVTMQSAANIIRDFIQTILGVKGLTEMLRQGEEELVARRASIIDLTRSVSNTIFTDADGETYTKQASSVQGLDDLWDRFAQQLAAVSGIPLTKLFGKQVAGLQNTGENDTRNYYDIVDSYRKSTLEKCLNWFLSFSYDLTAEETTWEWTPLWELSENDQADLELKKAQTDAIYIDKAAVDPEYLYHLRFSQDRYSSAIRFSQKAYLDWLEKRDNLDD